MLDLLIIGAGLAGLSAAYTAAQAGLAVRLIAKGQGATHWHAGTVDVLGYNPHDGGPVDAALEAVGRLARGGEHPYARLGVSAVQGALAAFAALTETIGLPYQGADEAGRSEAGRSKAGRNVMLPSPIGAARPVYLAPAAQVAGRLDEDQPMVIVGFEGLRDFYPKLIADNLNSQGHSARAVILPISLITKRREFNTVWLSEIIEDPGTLTRLGTALARMVRPGERIGLPAFLGFRQHRQVMDRLRQMASAAIFEIPTLPPSVPGIRLVDALTRHLNRMGVPVDIGMDVIGFEHDGDHIAWVATETSARPLKHRARHFLLATGGILGGGIDSDSSGRVWETIFDLPLTSPQQRADWFRPQFLDPAGQPVFQGGVRVNNHLQPVDTRGKAVFSNLWAAGGILAGADPIRERSLEGIAISTGMAAARQIANRNS